MVFLPSFRGFSGAHVMSVSAILSETNPPNSESSSILTVIVLARPAGDCLETNPASSISCAALRTRCGEAFSSPPTTM